MNSGLLHAWSKCLILVAALTLASCSRPPSIIGVEHPDIPVASIEDASIKKVFIATTRSPSDKPGVFLSANRSKELGLASVDVSIPPIHEVGNLERPKRLPPDPRTEFTVINPVIYASDAAFVRELNAALMEWPKGKREILLFIHGYNTSTTDAVLRLAQFAHDSGFEGVPILFSWASASQTAKYVFDLNSALIAREKVSRLSFLLDQTNAETYDILAHSMGTLPTMEGLLERSRQGQLNRRGRLGNVILASPDIDLDLFRSQLAQFVDRPDNFFVLLSKDDRALRLSRFIAGGVPRVGAANAEELAGLGVTVVDLSEVEDNGTLSHAKFAASPDIVKLIGRGLNQASRFDQSEATPQLEDTLVALSVRILF